ncbi:hypothetical protein AAG570_012054 [Ranatra chinensis]|uniref:Uncharacterized protein n=1 Tax=Ranatra chinensis TaxID=642074 RepID=A0ABD0Z002_9HEMI
MRCDGCSNARNLKYALHYDSITGIEVIGYLLDTLDVSYGIPSKGSPRALTMEECSPAVKVATRVDSFRVRTGDLFRGGRGDGTSQRHGKTRRSLQYPLRRCETLMQRQAFMFNRFAKGSTDWWGKIQEDVNTEVGTAIVFVDVREHSNVAAMDDQMGNGVGNTAHCSGPLKRTQTWGQSGQGERIGNRDRALGKAAPGFEMVIQLEGVTIRWVTPRGLCNHMLFAGKIAIQSMGQIESIEEKLQYETKPEFSNSMHYALSKLKVRWQKIHLPGIAGIATRRAGGTTPPEETGSGIRATIIFTIRREHYTQHYLHPHSPTNALYVPATRDIAPAVFLISQPSRKCAGKKRPLVWIVPAWVATFRTTKKKTSRDGYFATFLLPCGFLIRRFKTEDAKPLMEFVESLTRFIAGSQ